MNLDYLIIDVFTSEPFGGSRLNLFLRGDTVPESLMQKLALEMGCGETAFVVPARSGGSNRAGLRVFTPAAEIPFAGHSVLGATFAMDYLQKRESGEKTEDFVWELEAGNYVVHTRDDEDGRIYSLQQDSPDFLGQYFHRRKVASTLGLAENEITITGLPCEVISTGLPIHIVPVDSLETMERINLRRRDADSIAADLGFGDLYVFTCETINEESTVHCRMFAPHFGIPEDPASGSASGALVAYLVKHRLVKLSSNITVICEQGLEMGRPSRIIAQAEVVNGKARNITVGGSCVLVGNGTILSP
ncbi:MAG: PhzF family phenazine biosynthesis protein [bacterium]|nr:PhzF family phenazine biosynthesis protein [bacterium]